MSWVGSLCALPPVPMYCGATACCGVVPCVNLHRLAMYGLCAAARRTAIRAGVVRGGGGGHRRPRGRRVRIRRAACMGGRASGDARTLADAARASPRSTWPRAPTAARRSRLSHRDGRSCRRRRAAPERGAARPRPARPPVAARCPCAAGARPHGAAPDRPPGRAAGPAGRRDERRGGGTA